MERNLDRRVDPDLADEYVREKLGVMHPDGYAEIVTDWTDLDTAGYVLLSRLLP